MFRAILSAVCIACSILGSSGALVEDLTHISQTGIKQSFEYSTKNNLPRIIVADSDKTLHSSWKRGDNAPHAPLLALLRRHIDAGTTVAIVSARDVGSLEQRYGSIPGIRLYGEFGSMVYDPSVRARQRPTYKQELIPTAAIKEDIDRVIEEWGGEIPKNQRHVNNNCLTMGYVGIDHDNASVNRLVAMFEAMLEQNYARHEIQVEHVRYEQIINFRPPTADKGYFVKHVVPKLLDGEQGFVYVTGDSPPDEPMFTEVLELGNDLHHTWPVAVKNNPKDETDARYYVNNPDETQACLRKLL